ncbi:hypothetical protein B1R32_1037 [Abditibacterium utsteinense]|uniref:Uncharacterized protein n=1 Tax=Abditibacterium utsteinense TaxID=1960156 RepID=A0A2S8SVB3_9BACT|nr:hypothetical protein [Abditibacterium utsteinense]PQV64740.1 hypothetical protein B1R32_1037 [Abditibacterium utsteinense]
MHPGNLQNSDSQAKQWPDFYSILGSSPETDSETLRRSINTLYVKANEQSDHRELNTRFYNQVLTQKVLPQCRRILLNDQVRQAYNQQWYLHRDGAETALSYQDFIREVSKDANTANTLLLSEDEISILPGFGTEHSTAHSTARKTTAGSPQTAGSSSEVVEAEEVIEAPQDSSIAPAAPLTSSAFVVAPASPRVRADKKGFPILPALAALLVIGLGGFFWNSSRQAQELDEADPLFNRLDQVAKSKAVQPAADSAVVAPLDHPLLHLNTLVLNADFETGQLSPWVVTNKQAYVEAAPLHDAKSGSNILTFWDTVPYEATARQTISGLRAGKYTLRAWTQRTGGQQRAEMSVSGYGGPTRTITLPNQPTWTLAIIRDIDVKIDQCTINFSAKAPATKHVQIDGVEFFRQ